MTAIGNHSVVDLFFQLKWSSSEMRHTEAYAGRQVNLWRDLLPRRLMDQLHGKRAGDRMEIWFDPGELLDPNLKQDLRKLSRKQFLPERIGRPDLIPRAGRFYPKGVLKDVAGIFPANIEPFRCVQVNNGHLDVDLGHPLADRGVFLDVTIGAVGRKTEERGGGMRDWVTLITHGVGMQAPLHGQATDVFAANDFTRQDENADGLFYAKPRLVQHLDDTALDMVREIYGRFTQPGMRVLDLMASWDSHLPGHTEPCKVTGLGLNMEELSQNKALSDYLVHDLNTDPVLPMADGSFDTVVCTASVEYLVHPVKVFAEVARVLRPGGHFVATFSNRWFAPKTIALWTELHEFERMGLVADYFRKSGGFTDLQTYSVRGLDRPRHDKYYGRLWLSDPVFAVWGRKK